MSATNASGVFATDKGGILMTGEEFLEQLDASTLRVVALDIGKRKGKVPGNSVRLTRANGPIGKVLRQQAAGGLVALFDRAAVRAWAVREMFV